MSDYAGLSHEELIERLQAADIERDELHLQLAEAEDRAGDSAWDTGYAGHNEYEDADEAPSIFAPDRVIAYANTLQARKDRAGARAVIDRVRADAAAAELFDEYVGAMKQAGSPVRLP